MKKYKLGMDLTGITSFMSNLEIEMFTNGITCEEQKIKIGNEGIVDFANGLSCAAKIISIYENDSDFELEFIGNVYNPSEF